MQAFDIVGDIHGAAQQLRELLELLGYGNSSGVYSHPKRKIIFLGDFIDRGPKQREVIDIVRPMIEQGSAMAVMGNHEFNAIAYATPGPANPGEFLRKHNHLNNTQHQKFLSEFASDPAAYDDVICWFKSLPLYLELDSLRVVHACWHSEKIHQLKPYLNQDNTLNDELICRASRKGAQEYTNVETLLKGVEIPLPAELFIHDKDGVKRSAIRTKWWLQESASYQELALISSDIAQSLPSSAPPSNESMGYAETERPVFIGHYWLRGIPKCLAPNVCCVDYSVGEPGGKLCCYRWDGEQILNDKKLLWVERPL